MLDLRLRKRVRVTGPTCLAARDRWRILRESGSLRLACLARSLFMLRAHLPPTRTTAHGERVGARLCGWCRLLLLGYCKPRQRVQRVARLRLRGRARSRAGGALLLQTLLLDALRLLLLCTLLRAANLTYFYCPHCSVFEVYVHIYRSFRYLRLEPMKMLSLKISYI